jgi:hypothetical protein
MDAIGLDDSPTTTTRTGKPSSRSSWRRFFKGGVAARASELVGERERCVMPSHGWTPPHWLMALFIWL